MDVYTRGPLPPIDDSWLNGSTAAEDLPERTETVGVKGLRVHHGDEGRDRADDEGSAPSLGLADCLVGLESVQQDHRDPHVAGGGDVTDGARDVEQGGDG
jgi:hypothetical protein